MNKDTLHSNLKIYFQKIKSDPARAENDKKERADRAAYYQSWTASRIIGMTVDELYEYIAKLWAMRVWGNKRYVVDELLAAYSLEFVKLHLSDLVWGNSSIERRWDSFRKDVKGIGPAMMSELLCHSHPSECMLWNRRAYVALDFLGVEHLPRYNYQLTGAKYKSLCGVAKEIAQEMQTMGDTSANMLTVDYFIWDELQVEENLSKMFSTVESVTEPELLKPEKLDNAQLEFIHNEVRDKISEIGTWLGFEASTERKVASGAKVDAVWQATIGNMGRVIYVFEVQTKGSLDSLILNLLKSLNNPAVQGVVAVTDTIQIEKIKAEVLSVGALKDKLRYWNYQEVLEVHRSLESVNESINNLRLVPDGF
jgi:hypothetical protein